MNKAKLKEYVLALTMAVVSIFMIFLLVNAISHSLKVKDGEFDLNRMKTSLYKQIDMIVITAALCDYGESSDNELCKDAEAKATEARLTAKKLAVEISRQCPDAISQNLISNLIAIEKFLKFSYEERDYLNLELFRKEVYGPLYNTINDIVLFDFRKNCPDSIEMEVPRNEVSN